MSVNNIRVTFLLLNLNCKALSNFEENDSKKQSIVLAHTSCENTYLIFF
jgi:hypothetical protein